MRLLLLLQAYSLEFLCFRCSRTFKYAPLRFLKSGLSAVQQRRIIPACFVLSILLVSGCRFSLDELRNMDLEKKDFTTSLAREYRLMAQRKAALAGWWDADHFAEKGLRAVRGIQVDPEHPEDWDIAPEALAGLQQARRDLLDAVTGTAITLSPEVSARAYVLYDCWVEETEDAWRVQQLESCRTEFFETLKYLNATKEAVAKEKVLEYGKVQPEKSVPQKSSVKTPSSPIATLSRKPAFPSVPVSKPASMKRKALPVPVNPVPKPATVPVQVIDNRAPPATVTPAVIPPPAPQSLAYREEAPEEAPQQVRPVSTRHAVIFAENAVMLTPAAMEKIAAIAESIKGITAAEIILNGHVDKAENATDAFHLSRERAEAVRGELVKKGVDKARIQLYGFGASDPVMLGTDGQKHPENRRVEVFVQ